jgi:WD40 repeat protein
MSKYSHPLPVIALLLTGTFAYLGLVQRAPCQEIKEKDTLEAADPIVALVYSPDGKILATAETTPGAAGKVGVWDLTTGKKKQTYQGHMALVFAVAITADGKNVASGDTAGIIKVFETGTGKDQALPREDRGTRVLALSFSADGKSLNSVHEDATLRVWDLSANKAKKDPTFLVADNGAANTAASFRADGKFLAVGGAKGTIRVWDMAAGKESGVFKGHTAEVISLALSADGKLLVSGSKDKTVKLWDLTTGKEKYTIPKQAEYPHVALTPDGSILGTVSAKEANVTLWDAATGREKNRVEHGGRVLSIAFSADGKSMASGSNNEKIKLWSLPARNLEDR